MIYFDSAATTLQKPPEVARAVMHAMHESANAGRGEGSGYADSVLLDCRKEAAALFGASPEQVAFCFNATHALNIAINTLARGAQRCVISGYEHNAVRRPLLSLRDAGLETAVVRSPLFEPEFCLYELERELERGADFAAVTHVSNVFGFVLPIERVDEMCAEHGVPLIIDASQSAGCISLDLSKLRAARFVAMPGHKGLYGPQGTGLLICLGDAEPFMYGGTGQDSRSEGMPDYLPERLEAGTQNTHGIAGLAEGIRFVRSRTPEGILAHEQAIVRRILRGLSTCPLIKTYDAPHLFCQSGVLSMEVRGKASEEVAEALAAQGIATRAGLHCAPLAHETAGTSERGTLRVSPSAFSTPHEADVFCERLIRIARN